MLWLLCIGLFVWALTVQVHVPMPAAQDTPAARPSPHQPVEAAEGTVAAGRWENLFARQFQQPLFDPPPVTPTAEVPPEVPPPPIQLEGTAPEKDGRGSALFRDDNGFRSFVGVGAQIVVAGGAKIKLLKVELERVEVEYEGRTVTMELPPNKKE